MDGAIFLGIRIIHLNPKAPEKTTNGTGSVITFAVRPDKKAELIRFVREFIEKRSVSPDTGICCWSGIKLPHSAYTKRVKTYLFTPTDATTEPNQLAVSIISPAHHTGRIAALVAVL